MYNINEQEETKSQNPRIAAIDRINRDLAARDANPTFFNDDDLNERVEEVKSIITQYNGKWATIYPSARPGRNNPFISLGIKDSQWGKMSRITKKRYYSALSSIPGVDIQYLGPKNIVHVY